MSRVPSLDLDGFQNANSTLDECREHSDGPLGWRASPSDSRPLLGVGHGQRLEELVRTG